MFFSKIIPAIIFLNILFNGIQAQNAELPLSYVCYSTDSEITIDGHATETVWDAVPWTSFFTDIEGAKKPEPKWKTRAKMIWDKQYLYVYAEMEEPHVWANITQRDAVIFHDNDFEVFIDPDGDTHGYFEFEMNALNTVWDLLLIKPYRNGGPYLTDWDFTGLKSAVSIKGSINDPTDADTAWMVEIAFPLQAFMVYCATGMPKEGDIWRINFSRVEWKTSIVNGKYIKETNTVTGRPLPEDNWVWSPQGVIDMHQPEKWGYLFFTNTIAGTANVAFKPDPDEVVKSELRKIYHAQRKYYAQNKKFASHISELTGQSGETFQFNAEVKTAFTIFEAVAFKEESPWLWHIDQSGRTWKTPRLSK